MIFLIHQLGDILLRKVFRQFNLIVNHYAFPAQPVIFLEFIEIVCFVMKFRSIFLTKIQSYLLH